jgi:hypothetical protein
MNGPPTAWRRVRRLEAHRPRGDWSGPLPIVCPQDWPAAESAAWEAARAAGNGAALDALVERQTGMRRRPSEAGVRCIVDHIPLSCGGEPWAD